MFQTQKKEASTYGIVASERPVHSSEVETERPALEVIIQWGESSVLGVSHLEEAGSFAIGESGDGLDFCVPSTVLGQSRLELARLLEDGAVEVLLPSFAKGSLLMDGAMTPLAGDAGSHRVVPVPEGATARVEIGDLVFLVKGVRAGKRLESGFALERRPLAYFAAVAAFTALLLGAFSLMPPSSAALSVQSVDTGHRLVEYMIESAAVEELPAPAPSGDGSEGAPDAAAEAGGGDPGEPTAQRVEGRRGARGEASERETSPAQSAEERVRDSAVLRTLATLTGNLANAGASPFGAEDAVSADAFNTLASLAGGPLTSTQGSDPFAMITGRGRGGGGPFGPHSTFGGGPFATSGGPGGGEGGHGDLGRSMREHRQSSPRVIREQPRVAEGLSRTAIQRVVQRHVNEVRFCYQQALQSRPDLEGRLVTRFMISPNGSVQVAMTMPNSTLQNSRVEACVTQTVRRWTFPQTENGLPVSVTYPFSFRAN